MTFYDFFLREAVARLLEERTAKAKQQNIIAFIIIFSISYVFVCFCAYLIDS
jgi:hypothetical protein